MRKLPGGRFIGTVLIAGVCLVHGMLGILDAQEPLTAIRTARGFSDGRLVDPVAVFPPTATVFVAFQHAGLSDGAEVQSAWYFMTPDGPTAAGEAAAVVHANSPIAALSVAPPSGGWREGEYRVVLLIDAQQVGVATFTVSPTAPTATAAPTAPAAPAAPAATPPTAPTSAVPVPALTLPSPTESAPARTRSGFSVTAPAGWTVDHSATDVELRMTPQNGGDVIDVASLPAAVDDEPQTLGAAWESANVGRGKTFTVRLRSDLLTIAGQRAYVAVYAGAAHYSKVVFIAAPGRGVIVRGTFATTRFIDGEMVFDRMLRTATLAR